MTIVVAHFRVPLILLFRVGEAISDAQAGKIESDSIGRRRVVALINSMRNCRHIMSSVAFSHNVERRRSVVRVSLKKGLKEEVSIFCHHGFVAIIFFAIREADTSRLIKPQDMSSFRPAVGVESSGFGILVDRAGPVLGQKSQSRATAGAAREPHNKRSVFGNLSPLFKHPEKEVFVFPIFVVLGSFDVHVATNALGVGVANRIFVSSLILFNLEAVGPLFLEMIVGRNARRRGAIKNSFGEHFGLFLADTFTRHGPRFAPRAR
mmetsp:Transcript_8261/g.22914  ORF Transcript_8261/g.22914 Transcript_8261/m.22914 type:complete len:264 (+) Transcript_8261:805-1596(+)